MNERIINQSISHLPNKQTCGCINKTPLFIPLEFIKRTEMQILTSLLAPPPSSPTASSRGPQQRQGIPGVLGVPEESQEGADLD